MSAARIAAAALAVLLSGCLQTDLSVLCATPAYASYCTLSVTGASPLVASIAGGTTVTVTGTGFDADTEVTLGGPVTLSSRQSDQLIFTAPAHAPGEVELVISNSLGTVSLPTRFRYVDPPRVTTVQPASGARSGGYPVTVVGDNLAGGTVTIGGELLANLSSSATSITGTLPAFSVPGPLDVVVSAGGLSTTVPDGFLALTWVGDSQGWEEGSGVDLAAIPNSPGPLYLATSGGDLYRANDLASAWERVLRLRGTADHWVAVHPGNPQRVLSASGQGLALTNDGFLTSSSVSSAAITGGVAFNAEGSRVLAGGASGLLVSRDSGATFTNFATPEQVRRVASAPDDANVLAAVTRTTLYTSLNGGDTWTERALPHEPYALSVNALRAAVGDQSGLRLFPTDPITTSVSCSAELFTTLVGAPDSPSRLWGWGPGSVVRSTDTTANSCSAFAGGQPQPFGEVRDLQFLNGPTLVAATPFAVYSRQVVNVVWDEHRSGLSSPQVRALARQQTGSTRMLFAHSYRGQVYSRSAESWEPYGPSLGTNLARVDLRAFPEGSGFRLLSFSDTIRTLAPDAPGWIPSTGVSGSVLTVEEDVLNPALVNPVVVATTSGLFRSTDGGQTFVSIQGDLPPGVTLVEVEIDADTYFGISAEGRVFRAPAPGGIWTELARFTAEDSIRGMLRTTGGLILSGGNAGLFRLEDGASTWVATPGTPFASDLFQSDPNDRRILYGNRGGAFQRSSDRGETWRDVSDGTYASNTVEGVRVDPVDGRVYLLGSVPFTESIVGGP